MIGNVRFTITEDHLKLLRRACVSWNNCEFGAPSIDCKRPYGNSSVYQDMAEILGITPSGGEDDPFSDEQYKAMEQLHNETKTVLQIILTTGAMKPGVYESDHYSDNWQKVNQ